MNSPLGLEQCLTFINCQLQTGARRLPGAPQTNRRLQADRLSMEQALKKAGEEDRARWRYVNKYFGKDIDDPLLYHLVLNTDLLASEEAARFIAQAASAEPLAAAA
jgi:cytidylate kinase